MDETVSERTLEAFVCKRCKGTYLNSETGRCGKCNSQSDSFGYCKTCDKFFSISAGQLCPKDGTRLVRHKAASGTLRLSNLVLDHIILCMLAPPTFFLFGYMLACLGAGPDFFEDTEPIGSVLGFAYIFLYFFLSEMAWQRTPAKFITGTKVITFEGTKPMPGSIALRTLARFVPFEAISFLDYRVYGWHDKWSRTFVVRSRRLQRGTHSSATRVGEQSGRPQATTVTGSRFEAEGAASMSQGSKESPSLAALLKRECTEEGGAVRQTVEQTELLRYSEDSEPSAGEQINAMKNTRNQEATCDIMTDRQTSKMNKEKAKWLVLVLLAVILVTTITVRFVNTPAAIQAHTTDFVPDFAPLQQQRDLSTPSSRLVGRWENVDNGSQLLFSPIDPALGIGTYRIGNKGYGGFGRPFRFKILFYDPSGTRLVIRPYGHNEVLLKLSAEIRMDCTKSDVIYSIPKHGQSMTEEYTFGGSPMLSVYRYVDNGTNP